MPQPRGDTRCAYCHNLFISVGLFLAPTEACQQDTSAKRADARTTIQHFLLLLECLMESDSIVFPMRNVAHFFWERYPDFMAQILVSAETGNLN
jgi:hypothetical protein